MYLYVCHVDASFRNNGKQILQLLIKHYCFQIHICTKNSFVKIGISTAYILVQFQLLNFFYPSINESYNKINETADDMLADLLSDLVLTNN